MLSLCHPFSSSSSELELVNDSAAGYFFLQDYELVEFLHLAVTVGSPIVPVVLAGSGCFHTLFLHMQAQVQYLHMPAQVQYFPDTWVDLLSLALDDTTDPLASACRICFSRTCWKSGLAPAAREGTDPPVLQPRVWGEACACRAKRPHEGSPVDNLDVNETGVGVWGGQSVKPRPPGQTPLPPREPRPPGRARAANARGVAGA